MRKFEYKIEAVEPTKPDLELTRLNELGADGWVVVAGFQGTHHDSFGAGAVLLMRERKDE